MYSKFIYIIINIKHIIYQYFTIICLFFIYYCFSVILYLNLIYIQQFIQITSNTIGISFGTTYFCVGVFQNEKVNIIQNDVGSYTTPSYVAFTDTDRLIGESAKNQSAMNPENTVFDVKRIIGHRFSDKEVQESIQYFPFKVIDDGDDKPLIQVKYRGEVKKYTPEEILAMFLTKIKETASDYLGKQVKDAVITVPSYFTDAQRKAIQNSIMICGLKCLGIINEPTAACIAYNFVNKDKQQERKTYMIFHFGGGTSSCSIQYVDGDTILNKATCEDLHLGGNDLDDRLCEYFINQFQRKTGKNISGKPRAVRRLRSACERCKCTLSAKQNTQLEIESLYNGIDFYTEITRDKFEELCMDLFNKAVKLVTQVLIQAKMSKNDIEQVILTGGSIKIPKVQQLLKEYFNGKEPFKQVNPNEAYAYGATVYAVQLSGQYVQFQKRSYPTIDDLEVLN